MMRRYFADLSIRRSGRSHIYGDKYVAAVRRFRPSEGERNRDHIDDHAGQAFPIFSDGGRQSRGRAVMRDENLGQYEVGDARKEQHQTVERAIGNGAL